MHPFPIDTNIHRLSSSGTEKHGRASSWLQAILDDAPRPLRRLGGRAGSHGIFSVASSHRVIALEAPGGLELPISVIVPERVISDALDSRRVFIGNRQLVTRHGALQVNVRRDDRLRLNVSAVRAKIAAESMLTELAATNPPQESQQVHDAVAAFSTSLADNYSSADLETAAGDLIGLGFGSTPSGDDVIAGSAAALASIARSTSVLAAECGRKLETLSRVIRRSRCRTTALSAELMSCAVRGYTMRRFRRYANAAIFDGDIRGTTSRLCGTGHTSGYFLAHGAAVALSAVAKQAD